MHRPHTLLLRNDDVNGTFADFVASPLLDIRRRTRRQFRYCGQQEFEGHPCILLRYEEYRLLDMRPSFITTYRLASDRNLIPIRVEYYYPRSGSELALVAIATCSDFRELVPGVWYPWHAQTWHIEPPAVMQGMAKLTWRRDLQIESLVLAPQPEETLFRELVVPQGTKVDVIDRQGKKVRSFVQARAGNLEATQMP